MDITETILSVAKTKTKFKTSDVVRALSGSKSRQAVVSAISQLVKDNRLIKLGSTKSAFYTLTQNASLIGNKTKMTLSNANLKEHEVLDEIREKTTFINGLDKNIFSIFAYAFTEMLNNAIEHSKTDLINIEVEKNRGNLEFSIRDFGVGVFKNVMKKRGLKSELEAIQDLLKGKITTQPKAHSGEGIFFTSKIADLFILESFGLRLRIDNIINDVFIEEIKPIKKGTKIRFCIDTNSKKHLSNVFKDYQTDSQSYDFNKTDIKIRLYTMGTIYISRSQARRVLASLDKFKVVILDFDKVPTIGQSFADEIFRVFMIKHQNIQITPINMNETVKFMIDRVEKP